jgi:ABC-2 type transport system ATP-binding protein
VLNAEHLTRRFGDRVAVDDVSFDLAPGEVFALLGPNGAGKTTILRMLAGLIGPTSGSVRIDGEALTGESASRFRARIGFLTETPGLWDNLSVHQNLYTYARLYGLPAPDAVVAEALELFELTDRALERPARLSKGLRQRIALARCLLHKPRIVLLDEPTSGLDPASAREVRDLIVRLRDEGRSILICTHNLDEVDRLADRVAVLRARLIAVGTPAALRQRLLVPRLLIALNGPAERFAMLLRSAGLADATASGDRLSASLTQNSMRTPEIVRRLVEGGAGVESVVLEEPPLEDVYLKLLNPEAPK